MTRSYIEAPAGYGKTERLVQIVFQNANEKKILLLTHTNAGVDAINKRLKKYGVSSDKYNVYTIASFCRSWCKAYQKSASFRFCLQFQYPEPDKYYYDLYLATERLLHEEWVRYVLKNMYSSVIVDEYQDCLTVQHDLIFNGLGSILDLIILGDPLQGIFNFDKHDELVNLYSLRENCDSSEKLNIPWRWKTSEPELGSWIADVRNLLEPYDEQGKGTNLALPAPSKYIEYIKPTSDVFMNLPDFDEFSSVAYIARNGNAQENFCRRTGGRFAYHEKKDNDTLTDLINSINRNEFDYYYLEWLKAIFTNMNRELSTLEKHLQNGIYTTWNRDKYPDLTKLFMELHAPENTEDCELKRYPKILQIIQMLKNLGPFRCIRPRLYKLTCDVITFAIENGISLAESYSVNYEFYNSNLPRFVATRPSLSKGLEFDAIIIDVSAVTELGVDHKKSFKYRWDIRNFYVAISRAKKKIYFIGKPGKIDLSKYNAHKKHKS